jgi:hypothetical protein
MDEENSWLAFDVGLVGVVSVSVGTRNGDGLLRETLHGRWHGTALCVSQERGLCRAFNREGHTCVP